MLFFLFSVNGINAAPKLTPAKIKAAYTYKFTKFVTWPTDSAISKNQISICILGEEGISNELEPLDGRKIDGRLISINRLSSVQDAMKCHILYISSSKNHELKAILADLRHLPVLTISSIRGFAEHGGMIDFVLQHNKVKFRINQAAIKQGNLQISAKLLELSLKVYNRVSNGEVK